MKTSSLHWWKVKRWRKLEIVAVSFSSSSSLLSLHAHKCIYANNRTFWAKSVQAQMQVGCHWILSFALLLANSSSSSSIRRNRVFYMFSFICRHSWNKKIHGLDRFSGNGPYGKIPTKKEPIRMLGFTLRYNKLIYFQLWVLTINRIIQANFSGSPHSNLAWTSSSPVRLNITQPK